MRQQESLRQFHSGNSTLAGHPDIALEPGSCRQVPGSGISGVVQGAHVVVGSTDFVCSQLGGGEQGAADRFMEASTSQTSDSMQVSHSLLH